tara:strand:- start:1191 stop:2252 length:1062 start_codon:yes stop_codon:yes gene_type:complete
MAYTTIDKPQDYFNTLIYSGDGSSSSARTGVGFQPDWMWFKRRDGSGTHAVFDIVRGTNGTVYRRMLPQDSGAEDTASGTVLAIGSDGFTLGNDSNINQSGETYVSWNWLGSNTTATNTDGDLNSTVSVNTTAGFSIVGYTGTATTGVTVGHGLGQKPDMIILKNRGPDIASWPVYHSSLGASKYISLNGTTGVTSNTTRWNGTEPTSSVFTLGSSGDVKGDSSGETFIAYCFAEKKGYSKIGSYTGNGSSDGTFVYTGFKPAWLIVKQSSSSGESWILTDNKRSSFNEVNRRLFANNTQGENTSSRPIDYLSNGFKNRNSDAQMNSDGATYIFMAFAENPFVTSSGVPGMAR